MSGLLIREEFRAGLAELKEVVMENAVTCDCDCDGLNESLSLIETRLGLIETILLDLRVKLRLP